MSINVTRSSMPPLEEYVEMIRPLWESHWLTNMGEYHGRLEKELREYLDVDVLSLTTNGHSALEMAIQSMNFPEGSEVITTPFTFISTTHAIIRNGLHPIFCDIKPDDFTIDENKIEDLITDKTVAILPVHVYGNICEVEKIKQIGEKYDLKIIYDACHAFGETYKGEAVGRFGDMSVFSFHATKVYNTVEGGAICCHSSAEYQKLKDLKNFGIRDEETVASVGANAKMSEFHAAMGLCNLKYVEEEIRKRGEIYQYYKDCLKDVSGISMPDEMPELVRNYAYMPVVFESEEMRNRVYDHLIQNGFHSRKYFYPITADAACFRNRYRNVALPVARDISGRILVLPLYADLERENVEKCTGLIREVL